MMLKAVRWFGGLLQSLVLLLLPMVGPILRPDDHNFLRYYAAINRVVQPVMHQVFLKLRPQNGKTIKEHLFDMNEYSNAKYKKNFNENERSKLDNDESSKEFDITFLYKLLQLLCGLADTNDATWSTPGSLENSLKRLKDHRNVLAHEDISLTSKELREKIKDLEQLCRNVLNTTSLVTEIAEMEKRMEEVLLGGIDLWEPYRNALNRLRQEQRSVLLREGRQDVRLIGGNMKILNPFTWLFDKDCSHLDVEHIFTEVIIRSGGYIKIRDILCAKLPSSESPDTFIFSGPPGIGKTSLIRFLVHDWLSANPSIHGMENVDLVLPVEMRHVFSDNVRDLVKDEVLRNVFQNHLEIDDITLLLGNISVLWLLDGYDEANLKAKEVVKEILKKYPQSRVIITTRTEFRQELALRLNQMNRSCAFGTIEGFSSDNMLSCAKKLITSTTKIQTNIDIESVMDRFLKFCKDANIFVREIFSVPLYFTIVVLLWLDNPDQISSTTTESDLFYLLVEHIINRLIVRESYMQLNQRESILKSRINKFFDHLGKLLFKKTQDFSLKQYEVEDLYNICDELELPFTDSMSAFFICVQRPTASGVKEDYTIIHRTMMEFLIARAFCNKMISEGWDLKRTAEDWFISTKQTLVKYEAQNPELKDMYDFEKLSRDLPTDVYQRFREKRFAMSSEDFFASQDSCNRCCKKIEDNTYFTKEIGESSIQSSKNLWCHMRDNVAGMRVIFLVGYLSFRQQLNKEICEQLAFLYFKLGTRGYGDFSLWNSVVKEASDEQFNRIFYRYIENLTWAFHFGDFTDEAEKLLSYVRPKAMLLHYCYGRCIHNNVEITKDFSEILKNFVRTFMVYPLKIHLDLSYFLSRFNDQGIELTKSCLNLILKENSSCSELVAVRCPVNADILRLLKNAINLEELTVRLHGKHLSQLADLIKEIPNLKTINVAIDPSTSSGLEFPVLIPEDKDAIMDFVVLIDAFNVEIEHVWLTIKRLCSSTKKVVLHGSLAAIDPDKMSAYIYPVLSNIPGIELLEVILDISENTGVAREFPRLKVVKQRMEERSSNTVVNFKYCFANAVYPVESVNIDSESFTIKISSTIHYKISFLTQR